MQTCRGRLSHSSCRASASRRTALASQSRSQSAGPALVLERFGGRGQAADQGGCQTGLAGRQTLRGGTRNGASRCRKRGAQRNPECKIVPPTAFSTQRAASSLLHSTESCRLPVLVKKDGFQGRAVCSTGYLFHCASCPSGAHKRASEVPALGRTLCVSNGGGPAAQLSGAAGPLGWIVSAVH